MSGPGRAQGPEEILLCLFSLCASNPSATLGYQEDGAGPAFVRTHTMGEHLAALAAVPVWQMPAWISKTCDQFGRLRQGEVIVGAAVEDFAGRSNAYNVLSVPSPEWCNRQVCC